MVLELFSKKKIFCGTRILGEKQPTKQTTNHLKFMEVVGFDIKPSGISIIFATPTLPHKHYVPPIPYIALLCAQEKLGRFYGRFPTSAEGGQPVQVCL